MTQMEHQFENVSFDIILRTKRDEYNLYFVFVVTNRYSTTPVTPAEVKVAKEMSIDNEFGKFDTK